MNARAYYNELDPYAAQWLRNLIGESLIAPGDVDERDIRDVRADDLKGYTQCHFFAGIAGWSLALRLAGWPDDRPVWTGSCPCQPFSAAGKGKAADDERHLWPSWFPLIRQCSPPTVFGEQVEAAIGWGWLDAVFSDLEAEGYACGATVLPACSVGAPHIRQRLWFVANAERAGVRLDKHGSPRGASSEVPGEVRQQRLRADSLASGATCELAHPNGRDASAERLQRSGQHGQRKKDGFSCAGLRGAREAADRNCASLLKLANPNRARRGKRGPGEEGNGRDAPRLQSTGLRADSPWSDLIWLPCTDGKQRPTQPGLFPLASGLSNRVAQLRAAGNSIVPQTAAEFIRASM